MLTQLFVTVITKLKTELTGPRRDAGSYSTEAVLITALLVALALAAMAVLTAKVLAKINSVDLG